MSPRAKLFWAIVIIAAIASAPLTMMPRGWLMPAAEQHYVPPQREARPVDDVAKRVGDGMLFQRR